MKLYGQPETFETVSNSTLLLNEMALGTVPKFGVWFRVEIENNLLLNFNYRILLMLQFTALLKV